MEQNSLFKTTASKQQLQKEQIMVTQEMTSYSINYMKGNHINGKHCAIPKQQKHRDCTTLAYGCYKQNYMPMSE